MATAATTTPKPTNPWEMKVGQGAGEGYQYFPCPPGNYPGTVVGLYDIGHQHVVLRDGREQDVRKLILVFELTEKRPDDKPFILAERYTWSMRDNSNFYALVTNITGSKFKEGDSFNPLTLVGMPVMVSITNIQNGEKTYHNVGGVARYPKNFPTPPAPTVQPQAWSILEGKPFPPEADSLPYVYGKSIRALAEESAEWKKVGVIPQPATDDSEIPF